MPATLTFDDDFNSLSLWNGTSGTWSTTTAFADPTGASTTLNGTSIPGNGEQEWYVNANYAPTSSVTPWTVNNGVLTLTAAPAPASIAPLLGYNDPSQPGLPAMGSYQYTSGLIETNHSFTQTYGYFEMRAELPSGQGFWPAFWLMPANGSWPPELDVMEVLGKDPTTLYTTVHTLQTGTHTSSGVGSIVANMSTGFHTFAVDWEPTTITWYFDNKPVFQAATPADMNQPMYMIANLALGGSWGGNVDSTTPFPGQMQIDYIKAWNSNPYTTSAEGSTGAGQTFTGQANDTLTGTTGDDLFNVSLPGGETMTGGAGHDTYVWNALSWVGSTITDFQVGSDKLDLHALFPAYAGTDPIRDGYVTLAADGHGGYDVFVNPDGHATAANPWPTFVVDLAGVTDVGLTSANLLVDTAAGQTAASTFSLTNTFQSVETGGASDPPPPPPPPPPTGVTLTGGYDDVLTGTAGADTFIGSVQGTETMTGGAGADLFQFKTIPWTPDHITDFQVGVDKLDLHAIFPGYLGVDAVADGYVWLLDDGHGGTNVLVNPDGQPTSANPWPTYVADLEGVPVAGVSASNLLTGGMYAGQTITGAGYSDAITGTGGNDTLIASVQGTETITGGAGADLFVFHSVPWTPDHIADFQVGVDKLDLRALYPTYTGANAVAAGYVWLLDDGHGGTNVLVNPDGHATAANPWPTYVADLVGVPLASVSQTILAGGS